MGTEGSHKSVGPLPGAGRGGRGVTRRHCGGGAASRARSPPQARSPPVPRRAAPLPLNRRIAARSRHRPQCPSCADNPYVPADGTSKPGCTAGVITTASVTVSYTEIAARLLTQPRYSSCLPGLCQNATHVSVCQRRGAARICGTPLVGCAFDLLSGASFLRPDLGLREGVGAVMLSSRGTVTGELQISCVGGAIPSAFLYQLRASMSLFPP